MIHLLVPMSGQGTRYQKVGFTEPKPAIEINGTPMLERLLQSIPTTWPSVFVMAENHQQSSLPKLVKKLRPQATQKFIPILKEGPLAAIQEGLNHIPADAPVFVSYCDYGMIWDASRFEQFVKESDCDACVVSYRGFHAHYLNHTTYAYSRLEGELVKEVREKGSFTDHRENEFASCGAYYFKSAEILRQALDYQKKHDLKVNGEFYTSLTVQALLLSNPQAQVRVFEIPYFFQWGTPQDLWNFEYWENTFKAFNKTGGKSPGSVSQVLMPMAGKGSRFKSSGSTPKPLIQIDSVPMYKWAMNSLPAGKTTLVALKEFNLPTDKNVQMQLLDQTPEGQALSTQAGVAKLDMAKDVLVSSCDHSIVLEDSKWEKFIASPECDAAIFTVKGFPGVLRKPQAFAYVQSDGKGAFPKISKISVKETVSNSPRGDSLLTGTFWFRTAGVMNEYIELLKKDNIRVNGELYLDSVFQLMIKNGLSVREIALDGYINWGDPDSLNEAAYWFESFCGRKLTVQPRLV